MKDFIYIDDYGLRAIACEWLRAMGLKETRWILDIEWFLTYAYDGKRQLTFSEWAKE